jgi:hypothetical protein
VTDKIMSLRVTGGFKQPGCWAAIWQRGRVTFWAKGCFAWFLETWLHLGKTLAVLCVLVPWVAVFTWGGLFVTDKIMSLCVTGGPLVLSVKPGCQNAVWQRGRLILFWAKTCLGVCVGNPTAPGQLVWCLLWCWVRRCQSFWAPAAA